ncbi:hypothetical protein B7P43_G09764 [Cryptotermes secundus]|uniref:Lipase domain-containing protein n=1 Tax=Cryptotermes secundus TaxID=105785 RepID=A0A2J7RH50_9NEOP|nr:phospholipase A1 [Cryptotermes secundus]XP_023727962.1 phospholipase A1 [Cryptotermes secundus]PNF40159.1 hypothetical protein B7P43_G09764 [Cryptotermes secundus]
MCSLFLPLILLAHIPSLLNGEKICCPDGECYSMDPPWRSLIRPVPAPNCVEKVQYLLYTRSNPSTAFNFSSENTSLEGSYFDASKPTMFFFHGWRGSVIHSSHPSMASSYLVSVDANVFLVDYSDVASNLYYPQPVSDLRVLARIVARFVRYIVDKKGVSKDGIHLMGLSLGAHLVGYIGKEVPGIRRITGLDPAGPLFKGEDCQVRLCKGDGQFVESVQTNKKYVLGFGTPREDYDVTFAMNGGMDQPSCGIDLIDLAVSHSQSRSDNNSKALVPSLSCSHEKSQVYYTEALRVPNCTFWGIKEDIYKRLVSVLSLGHGAKIFVPSRECEFPTCLPMGIHTIDYPASGVYIVPTNTKEPYCIKKPETSEDMKEVTIWNKPLKLLLGIF